MADLTKLLLEQIETGRLEEAALTLNLIGSRAADPDVCNQATLDTLQKAKVLALIHRSHIQRQLRSLQASRLFDTPTDNRAATWQIEA